MHPDLAELLDLRDEPEAPGAIADHVAGCAFCRAEFERLQHLRTAMRATPDVVGRDAWPEVIARLEHRPASLPLPRPTWRIAGTLAAVMAIAIGLALFDGSTVQVDDVRAPTPMPQAGATDPGGDSIAALMQESRRLESLLAAMPEEPRVARAATVLTTAGLEDRIEWVDLAIGANAASSTDAATVAPLWRQRVDLMNSLVAVRYAEARTTSY